MDLPSGSGGEEVGSREVLDFALMSEWMTSVA